MQSEKISILTNRQKIFLKSLAKSDLSNKFIFTGGTALAEYYIYYRYSDDLDFFSEDDIEIEEVLNFISDLKPELKFEDYNYTKSWNRNLIYLNFEDEILKTEFTYFPFPRSEKIEKIEGILVEPVKELAINKLFTIYQNPRYRDFTDLFMILEKYKFTLDNIKNFAQIKFETHLDEFQLAKQFEKCKVLEDIPKYISKFEQEKFEKWIENISNSLLNSKIEK